MTNQEFIQELKSKDLAAIMLKSNTIINGGNKYGLTEDDTITYYLMPDGTGELDLAAAQNKLSQWLVSDLDPYNPIYDVLPSKKTESEISEFLNSVSMDLCVGFLIYLKKIYAFKNAYIRSLLTCKNGKYPIFNMADYWHDELKSYLKTIDGIIKDKKGMFEFIHHITAIDIKRFNRQFAKHIIMLWENKGEDIKPYFTNNKEEINDS